MSTPTLETYRQLGPFDCSSLPEGLRRKHQLKEGTWGHLTVQSGEILFHWDDLAEEKPALIETGQELTIPPGRPHHLEVIGPFRLLIEFQREAGSGVG